MASRPSLWHHEVYHGFTRLLQRGKALAFVVADTGYSSTNIISSATLQHNQEMAEVLKIVNGFITRATESRNPDELYMAMLDFLDTWDQTWGIQKEDALERLRATDRAGRQRDSGEQGSEVTPAGESVGTH